MATRSRSNTRSQASRSSSSERMQDPSRGSYDDDMNGSSREGMSSGGGGLRKTISEGVRVTAEMPDPRVARITIDIDWQKLVARVARTVGRKVKGRGSRTATSRRSTTRRRTSRSSART